MYFWSGIDPILVALNALPDTAQTDVGGLHDFAKLFRWHNI